MAFDALKDVPEMLSQRCMRESEIILKCKELGANEDEVNTGILDSLVMFKMIKKVGLGVYADKAYEADEVPVDLGAKKAKTDDVLFPENVVTPLQQIDYLLSPMSQILARPKYIEYSESNPSNTGKFIRDALKASVTFHSVNIAPHLDGTKNLRVSSTRNKRSGSFTVAAEANGGLRVVISGYIGERAEKREIVEVFPTFNEFMKFLLENL